MIFKPLILGARKDMYFVGLLCLDFLPFRALPAVLPFAVFRRFSRELATRTE